MRQAPPATMIAESSIRRECATAGATAADFAYADYRFRFISIAPYSPNIRHEFNATNAIKFFTLC